MVWGTLVWAHPEDLPGSAVGTARSLEMNLPLPSLAADHEQLLPASLLEATAGKGGISSTYFTGAAQELVPMKTSGRGWACSEHLSMGAT